MDFLDPKKERLNQIVLLIGYGLVAIAIAIASVILLSVTDGYCVGGNETIDKCGLVFVSSQPSGATVALNDKQKNVQTNTKLNLASSTYNISLNLTGYREWKHQVTVLGGDVQRFDYPVLFPNNLQSTTVANFPSTIGFMTQSPNKKWVVIADDVAATTLHLYDMSNPKQPVISTIALPSGVVTTGDNQNWTVIGWADDNQHVLVRHSFTTNGTLSQEYILISRQSPDTSRNLTHDLSLTSTDQLSLFNEKYSQYYVYNTETKVLHTAALNGNPSLSLQLENVIAFKTYADDIILYATDTPPSGKTVTDQVSIVLQQGNQTRVIRNLPSPAQTYLLDIAQYSGDWYVIIGTNSLKGLYVYENPLSQTLATAKALPQPMRFLRVPNATYAAFSANARYIVAESGQHFGVYDIEYDATYNYTTSSVIDQPQAHAVWMDSGHLMYVSGGKLVVFDYDDTNSQVLEKSLPSWPIVFASDYSAIFNLQSMNTGLRLESTSLLVK